MARSLGTERVERTILCPQGWSQGIRSVGKMELAAQLGSTQPSPRRRCGSARIYSALASPPGGSARTATRGQAFEVQLGHVPVHEIGHDARSAAGHGPAHVAVAAVEEEVAVAAETEDGRAIWRHRAEARTVLTLLV